ncbi:MAG: hypothetical protein ACK5LY_00955 [Lachnospirales bacterium]
MLKREYIQNIFSMYIDGVTIDEINNIYQKKFVSVDLIGRKIILEK